MIVLIFTFDKEIIIKKNLKSNFVLELWIKNNMQTFKYFLNKRSHNKIKWLTLKEVHW